MCFFQKGYTGFRIPKGVALNNEGEEGASLRKDGHTLHVGLLRVRAAGTVYPKSVIRVYGRLVFVSSRLAASLAKT